MLVSRDSRGLKGCFNLEGKIINLAYEVESLASEVEYYWIRVFFSFLYVLKEEQVPSSFCRTFDSVERKSFLNQI